MASSTGYSGLFEGVHGDAQYTQLVGRAPMRGLMRVLLQKRGLFGYAKEAGGTVPANRARIDPELPHGGVRTINSEATQAEVSAAVMDEVANTDVNHTYVADLSGNGGAAFS